MNQTANRLESSIKSTVLPALLLFVGTALPTLVAGPPSLFLSEQQLAEVRSRLDEQPYASQFGTVRGLANNYLDWTADPFFMSDIRQIRFGWCSGAGAPDDTLKDLTEKLTEQSNRVRYLALAGLLTGDEAYYVAARNGLMKWATESTILNLYDLNIDFRNASMDDSTSGFCSDRPWNMALDSMWQCYGLINFADTYIILSRNWEGLSPEDDATMRSWLRELAGGVNSSFHAWTRWADLHPSSGAYTRYRSDNHLGWALAGLTAAAAALEDQEMWDYVLAGGSWDDGRSGPYENPSHLRDLIDRAILSDGKVYDQDVRAGEHKGFFYGNFHLWALSLSTLMAEVHQGENLWTHEGEDGGSLAKALMYYAPYVAGEREIPDAEETTDPKFFRFLYEIVTDKSWVDAGQRQAFVQARDVASRNQLIAQAIGPVMLLLAEQGDAEFDLGGVQLETSPEGELIVRLPEDTRGSLVLYSTNLQTWNPYPDFDPNVQQSFTIPSTEMIDGSRMFFRLDR